MPKQAQMIPLPRLLQDDGRVRFGLHGLSYESIIGDLFTANAANAPVVSSRRSAVAVRVMPTNEERMIARHTIGLLGSHQDSSLRESLHA